MSKKPWDSSHRKCRKDCSSSSRYAGHTHEAYHSSAAGTAPEARANENPHQLIIDAGLTCACWRRNVISVSSSTHVLTYSTIHGTSAWLDLRQLASSLNDTSKHSSSRERYEGTRVWLALRQLEASLNGMSKHSSSGDRYDGMGT